MPIKNNAKSFGSLAMYFVAITKPVSMMFMSRKAFFFFYQLVRYEYTLSTSIRFVHRIQYIQTFFFFYHFRIVHSIFVICIGLSITAIVRFNEQSISNVLKVLDKKIIIIIENHSA